MKFTYAEAMTDPAFYVPLAQAAEDAGFDSFLVPDSVAYPEHSDSVYPFNPDGSREFLDGKPFLEPFALISALGTVTERIRFTISVLKLPIRHPVHVAKLASTAAVMSGNRLTLGVGVSPWPEDYALTGTPWERRGQRMDECIEVVQGLLEGGYFEHHGEAIDVPSIKICPVPSQHVPLLVGGHSEAALRRAARHDGWIHGGGEHDDLPTMINRLHDLRAELGRGPSPSRSTSSAATPTRSTGSDASRSRASPRSSSASGGPTRSAPTSSPSRTRSTSCVATPIAPSPPSAAEAAQVGPLRKSLRPRSG